MKARLGLTGVAALAAAIYLPAGPALAQDDVDEILDEVIVTARKREESLQEVPVAITAFGIDDIRNFDLRQLENIGDLTPGFQFKNQGNQQPGRYNTQLQFRGLTTAQFSPSFATGALFIDGVYVLNGGTSLSLMDVERVEVIKGPQSAYFGRNTFGGAVNLITRAPSLEAFGADVNLSLSDRGTNDYSVFVEGPLVRDRLSASLSARLYDKRGQFRATDGGRLGNEETTAYNLAVRWVATDRLNFKLRYGYSEDDDGPPAAAFISGILNDSCTGLTVDTAEGPANPERYICGTVPGPDSAVHDDGVGIITHNTSIPQIALDLGLTDPSTNIADVPQVDTVGMKRETERWSLAADYTFANDYTLDFVVGSNEQGANWIRDFDLTDRVNWFSRDPQYMEDTSYELRLTSNQDGRFRWLVGVNRYDQEFTSSGQGGDAFTNCLSFTPVFTDDFPGACNLQLLFDNSLFDTDEAEVTGIFAAFDFDLTDEITLIVEGRHQEEEFTKGGGLVTPGAPVLTETFDDFLPRVIARWQPTDSTNLFVSYSEGLIAGEFNTTFINADERERAQYIAAEPTLSETTPPEELQAIEFGWKQNWAQGRVTTNLAVFRNEWSGIKGRSSVAVNETCRTADIDDEIGCATADGIGVGDPKQVLNPDTGELEPVINTRNVLLAGDGTITGLEIESWFRPTTDLTITANLSWIDFEYDDYDFNFVEQIAGFAQMRGNQSPRQPEWSGNATATQYFTAFGSEAYVRGEYIYQGTTFVDESNLAELDSYSLFNLRAGISADKYLVEVFVKNLFDEDKWATGARWTDFGSPFQGAFFTAKQGVAVTPLDKREVGVRVTYRFGE